MEHGMDASEAEAFLVLAGELHFGRTGERLRLSRSCLAVPVRALRVRAGAWP
jgi:DNA-binding transcriptional LysR family regulator